MSTDNQQQPDAHSLVSAKEKYLSLHQRPEPVQQDTGRTRHEIQNSHDAYIAYRSSVTEPVTYSQWLGQNIPDQPLQQEKYINALKDIAGGKPFPQLIAQQVLANNQIGPKEPSPSPQEPVDRMITAIRETTERLIAEGPEACRKFLQDAGILEQPSPPLPEIEQEKPLEMIFRLSADNFVFIAECPDEDEDFTISIENHESENSLSYPLYPDEARDLVCFLTRHLSNLDDVNKAQIFPSLQEGQQAGGEQETKMWCYSEDTGGPRCNPLCDLCVNPQRSESQPSVPAKEGDIPEEKYLPKDVAFWLADAADKFSHQPSEQEDYKAGAKDMYWAQCHQAENPTRLSFVKFAYGCMNERDQLQRERKADVERIEALREERDVYRKALEKLQHAHTHDWPYVRRVANAAINQYPQPSKTQQ
jgi:hypothetical protein